MESVGEPCEQTLPQTMRSRGGLRRRQRDSTPEPSPASAALDVPRTPPPKGSGALPDISPNPFPEPTASLETYRSHIYGTIAVSNPPLAPKISAPDGTSGAAAAQPVTVLAVRKKKRKSEAA